VVGGYLAGLGTQGLGQRTLLTGPDESIVGTLVSVMCSRLRAELWDAGELLESDTEPLDGAQQAEGVKFRGTAGNDAGAERSVENGTGKCSRSRGGTRRDQFGHAGNQRDSLARGSTSADLDANGTDPALAVGWSEHRETGGEAVTSIRRYTCADPMDFGEVQVNQHR
jgi:hypothetical protein